MFERYTEKARRIIFFSRYEASAVGSPYINPEHMLLGVLREDKALMTLLLGDSAAAFKMGEEVRAAIGEQARPHVSTAEFPLSHESKRVLAYAFEESTLLASKYVEPAHLLLGLLREPSLVSPVLARFGLELSRVRELLGQQHPDEAAQRVTRNTLLALRESFAQAVLFIPPEVEPSTTFRLHRGPRQ